ncbi:MAG: hypothetical protein QGF67_15920 [Lentisphaeria bacterium]|nr:hypothetical protein [Lentisphaeria bacterium]MDP7742927.1 hypothetical protein [Lentisphaeria bacterium]
MLKTVTRSGNHQKKSRAKAQRRKGIAMVSRYRYALATPLTASSAQAQWQPHTIKVGDGHVDQVQVPAQIQAVKFPGCDVTLPFGIVAMDNGELAMLVVNNQRLDPQ